MKLFSLLAVLVLAAGVAACGADTGTSPPSASPSASASPSPKPLTEAEKAATYLLAMKNVRSSFYSADEHISRLAGDKYVRSSQTVRDSYAKKIGKLVRKMEDIQVRFTMLDVPSSMTKLHKLFGQYMAQEVSGDSTLERSLAADEWPKANSLMNDANGFFKKAGTLNASWYIEVRSAAKKLGIKVPWKWRD